MVLLSCLYRDKEFVRVGYYVHNEYMDEELRENPPASVQVDKLQRSILADKPKVTRYDPLLIEVMKTEAVLKQCRYTIDWTNPQNDPLLQEAAALEQHDNEVWMIINYFRFIIVLVINATPTEHDGPIISIDG